MQNILVQRENWSPLEEFVTVQQQLQQPTAGLLIFLWSQMQFLTQRCGVAVTFFFSSPFYPADFISRCAFNGVHFLQTCSSIVLAVKTFYQKDLSLSVYIYILYIYLLVFQEMCRRLMHICFNIDYLLQLYLLGVLMLQVVKQL